MPIQNSPPLPHRANHHRGLALLHMQKAISHALEHPGQIQPSSDLELAFDHTMLAALEILREQSKKPKTATVESEGT